MNTTSKEIIHLRWGWRRHDDSSRSRLRQRHVCRRRRDLVVRRGGRAQLDRGRVRTPGVVQHRRRCNAQCANIMKT